MEKALDFFPGGCGGLRAVTDCPEFIERPWRQFGHSETGFVCNEPYVLKLIEVTPPTPS